MHSHRNLIMCPPHVQDASKDTAAGFLACQTSTPGVLAAVRKGYTARHNILAQALAIKVETVRLPEPTCLGPQEHCIWKSLACIEMTFSHCGRWLAVVLVGHQSCTTAEEWSGVSSKMFEIVLYSVSGQLQQQARVCTGTSQPTIQWAEKAPHLCVAVAPASRAPTQLPESHRQDLSAQPAGFAAFVLDAQTGSRIHALGPEVAAFSQLLNESCPAVLQHISWLPCSSSGLLLVQWQRWDNGEGFLSAFDIQGNMAVAGSVISTPLGRRPFGVAAWCPSIRLGVVLPAVMTLQQPDSFSQAGIAVANLPDPYAIQPHPAAFSSDGKHLIAWPKGWRYGDYRPNAKGLAVFSCSLQGVQISFTLEHVISPRTLELCWVPGMPRLFVRESSSGLRRSFFDKLVTLPKGSQPDRFLVATSNVTSGWRDRSFSLSGKFLAGGGPRRLVLPRSGLWPAAVGRNQRPQLG